MQNNVIEFRARELTGFLDLEGTYLESVHVRRSGPIVGGKDRLAAGELAQFPRDRQSVVAYSVERPRRPRYDLKNCFQESGKETVVTDLIGEIGGAGSDFLRR